MYGTYPLSRGNYSRVKMHKCWVSFLEPIIHSYETQKAESFGVPGEISYEIELEVGSQEKCTRLYHECICKYVR